MKPIIAGIESAVGDKFGQIALQELSVWTEMIGHRFRPVDEMPAGKKHHPAGRQPAHA